MAYEYKEYSRNHFNGLNNEVVELVYKKIKAINANI